MNARDRHRHVDIERLERGRVDHAKTGQLDFRAEPQRGRLARMIDLARIAQHLQAIHRRSRNSQQFKARRFGIERIK